MVLEKYRKKRDFSKTPEPLGEKVTKTGNSFVVQKHDARALHFDFRLEWKGVLLSWAVPKGPSLNPLDKRLAVQTEDHPIEYENFEGIIPPGNYGAGTVMLWDKGIYSPANDFKMKEMLKKGHLSIILDGEKLKGEFDLVKIKGTEKNWLLIKKKDRYASSENIGKQDDISVVSRKSIKEIKNEAQSIWENDQEIDLSNIPTAPVPHAVRPMLAETIQKPFDSDFWLFEIKWDGYRVISEISQGQVNIYSRNLKSFNLKFPGVAFALKKLNHEAILDGEVVFLDDDGKPNFQKIQSYEATEEGHIVYMVFDLLFLDGHNLIDFPLIKRKEILKAILPNIPKIRFSDHVEDLGVRFFEQAVKQDLEGIIAKKKDSVYELGRRSKNWLKIKTKKTTEAVITGFLMPKGGQKYFSSLILGAYENDHLIHIGNVGSGFSAESLKIIYEKLISIKTDSSSFIPPLSLKDVVWVDPILVCEVEYAEFTKDKILRQAVFKGLREDKSPKEVKLSILGSL